MKSSTSVWEISPPSLYNNLITKDDIEDILTTRVTGFTGNINDIRVYRMAFVHNSFLKRTDIKHTLELTEKLKDSDNFYHEILSFNPGESYQRLEFLGDSCIKYCISKYLFLRFPKAKEGMLTDIRIKLERKENLAKFGFYIGLDKYLLLSSFAEKKGERKNPKFMEDVFESFCGAMSLDLGSDIVYDFLKYIIEETIDFRNLILINNNYKSILLSVFHKNNWKRTPTYSTIHDPDNTQEVKVGVNYTPMMKNIVKNPITIKTLKTNKSDEIVVKTQKVIAIGVGSVKKEAEQNAAKNTLVIVNLI